MGRRRQPHSSMAMSVIRKYAVATAAGVCMLGGCLLGLRAVTTRTEDAVPAVQAPATPLPPLSWKVVRVMPHDTSAFTQGLTFHHGKLIEGTGLYGQSTLRELDKDTGLVIQNSRLDDKYFGEGVCSWGDHLIQLTWHERTAFVARGDNLQHVDRFSYSTVTGEGWGITHDGTHLIVSDGSQFLHFLDPATRQEVKRVAVHRPNGRPVHRLNELEYINGYVMANIWYDDHVAQIDPASGTVVRMIDFSSLYPKRQRPSDADCFNGIAVEPDTGLWYVTGKLWDKMFVLRVDGL